MENNELLGANVALDPLPNLLSQDGVANVLRIYCKLVVFLVSTSLHYEPCLSTAKVAHRARGTCERNYTSQSCFIVGIFSLVVVYGCMKMKRDDNMYLVCG